MPPFPFPEGRRDGRQRFIAAHVPQTQFSLLPAAEKEKIRPTHRTAEPDWIYCKRFRRRLRLAAFLNRQSGIHNGVYDVRNRSTIRLSPSPAQTFSPSSLRVQRGNRPFPSQRMKRRARKQIEHRRAAERRRFPRPRVPIRPRAQIHNRRKRIAQIPRAVLPAARPRSPRHRRRGPCARRPPAATG